MHDFFPLEPHPQKSHTMCEDFPLVGYSGLVWLCALPPLCRCNWSNRHGCQNDKKSNPVSHQQQTTTLGTQASILWLWQTYSRCSLNSF